MRSPAARTARLATLAFLIVGGLLYTSADAAERVEACGPRPNCVSSRSSPSDAGHHVAPLVLKGDLAAAWERVRAQVRALPRTSVLEESDDTLQVVVRSLLFRFPDDFVLRLDRATGRVDVRSASRYGYGDFGVNRRRIEGLRAQLRQEGIVE